MTSDQIAYGILGFVLLLAIIHTVVGILFPPKGKK
jgi:hypothetical protein